MSLKSKFWEIPNSKSYDEQGADSPKWPSIEKKRCDCTSVRVKYVARKTGLVQGSVPVELVVRISQMMRVSRFWVHRPLILVVKLMRVIQLSGFCPRD